MEEQEGVSPPQSPLPLLQMATSPGLGHVGQSSSKTSSKSTTPALTSIQSVVLEMKELRQAQAQARNENLARSSGQVSFGQVSSGQTRGENQSLAQNLALAKV